jgi:CHAT domain-containing protein
MTRNLLGGLRLTLAAAVAFFVTPAIAQTSLVAPPRSINDITTVIERETPDAARVARNRAMADAQPPAGAEGRAKAQFYYERAQARAILGRSNEAIADTEAAIKIGGDYVRDVSRYQQFLSGQYRVIGDLKRSIAIDEDISKRFEEIGRNKARFFGSNLRSAMSYLGLGDIKQAEVFVAKNVALLAEARKWRNFETTGPYFEAMVENGKARVLAARGKYREAEHAYDKAQAHYQKTIANIPSWPGQNPPTKQSIESTMNFLLAFEGQAKARQGRLTEGEADIRRALLNMLQASGKYSPDAAQVITMLANMLGEQRRWREAEKLARTALDVYRQIGISPETPVHARALNQLASTLNAQSRYDEAEDVYDQVDAATKGWDPERAANMRLQWSRIFNNYYTRNVETGIDLARQALARQQKRVGDNHLDTANARAVLAAGLTFARKDQEALKEFGQAMPALLAASRDSEDDDVSVSSAADSREKVVVEAYLALLSRNRRAVPNVASESFRLGERIRGHAVESALSASSARATASDPALAELARKEQDLQKTIGAGLGVLNNMLGLPAGERDEKELAALRANIDKLRTERAAARTQIEKRFPGYADLVAPKAASVEEMRGILKPGEVFVSFYFGRRGSFVWAIPKDGEVGYAYIPLNGRDLTKKVDKLREALEPKAESFADIPPFDLAAAYELYEQLLKPVEHAWKPAKTIIMVTNGALGLLPLGVLPTEAKTVNPDSEPVFGGYREVAWLARTHAITSVPSAAALRTLRKLPPGRGNREKFIAFGDPLFSNEQAAEWRNARELQRGAAQPIQVAQLTTRGLKLIRRAAPELDNKDSATIAALPRLPDTADELHSIALALEADPAKVLHLGIEANEKRVKSTDLSKFKIIAFATHGLVPGELDGLRQPALALSAPNVADVDGDGLLTMEEILGLKLDADWVVLSACNTGTGSGGAGAEAASGLGRAFFYAGTRALLVTNWSVHSASARELVTDLFRRQAQNPKLTRGEALRQAMMALADGPGLADGSGRTLVAYAHPLFWAPYTIIGDGGS